MSLFDSASLVVTPNGTKASKLYAIKPTDGSGDLSVTRATTATRVNSSGLIESVATNVPRLDYTNGSCPSILVEPQRTNLATFSEQFNDASWTKLSATITANSSVAPSGNTTADTLVITSGGYLLKQVIGYSAVSGQSVTISIFAKNQTTNFLTFGGATTAGTDVYTIQDYGNGWYRHIRTRTFTATATTTLQYIISTVGTHIIWGSQIEVGSYATSYIPTTSASVTRNADVLLSIANPLLLNDFSIFMDFKLIQKNQSLGYMIFGSVDSANISRIYIDNADNMNFTIGATNNSIGKSGLNINTNYKICFKRSGSNLKYFRNGVLINTFTVQTNQFKLTSFFNGVDGGGDTSKYITLGNLKYGIAFSNALTDDECINLTTL